MLLHLKPQVPFELHVAVALAGAVHGVQLLVPHERGLLLDRHCPLQLCVPSGQTPMQAWPTGMHWFAHTV